MELSSTLQNSCDSSTISLFNCRTRGCCAKKTTPYIASERHRTRKWQISSFKLRSEVKRQQHPAELLWFTNNVTVGPQNLGVLYQKTTPDVVSERHGTRKWQFRSLNRIWTLELSSTLRNSCYLLNVIFKSQNSRMLCEKTTPYEVYYRDFLAKS